MTGVLPATTHFSKSFIPKGFITSYPFPIDAGPHDVEPIQAGFRRDFFKQIALC